MIDLKKMSMHELYALRIQVEQIIRITSRRDFALQRQFKRVQKLAAEKGLSVQDLLHLLEEIEKVLRRSSPIQYRSPVNSSQDGSEHGRISAILSDDTN